MWAHMRLRPEPACGELAEPVERTCEHFEILATDVAFRFPSALGTGL